MPLPTQSILLVEDDPNHAEIFQFYAALFDQHFSVQWLADGQAAIDFATQTNAPAQNLPALIFLDLKLPRFSGHEVLAALKSNPLTRRIPTIIFSSSDAAPDVARAFDLGANSYLKKPLQPDAFKAVLFQAFQYWALNTADATLYHE